MGGKSGGLIVNELISVLNRLEREGGCGMVVLKVDKGELGGVKGGLLRLGVWGDDLCWG